MKVGDLITVQTCESSTLTWLRPGIIIAMDSSENPKKLTVLVENEFLVVTKDDVCDIDFLVTRHANLRRRRQDEG